MQGLALISKQSFRRNCIQILNLPFVQQYQLLYHVTQLFYVLIPNIVFFPSSMYLQFLEFLKYSEKNIGDDHLLFLMLFFPVSHSLWILSSFQQISPSSINILSLALFPNIFCFFPIQSLPPGILLSLILARSRELNYILSALPYITAFITLCS